MSRPFRTAVAFLLIALTVCTGCHPTQPFFFSKDSDLSHYLAVSEKIEYPDVCTTTLADAKQTKDPLTISNPEFDKLWDLTLQECVNIAMQNSKVLRSLGGYAATNALSPQNNYPFELLSRPDGVQTIYDPDITESNPSFRSAFQDRSGQLNGAIASGMSNPKYGGAPPTAANAGGVEAALAEFDANLSVSGGPRGVLARDNRPLNREPPALNNNFFPNVTDSTLAGVSTVLGKKTATGAAFYVKNFTSYEGTARAAKPTYQPLSDYWNTELEVGWDQPLLRGRGAQINRIPLMLARINKDISLADFGNSASGTWFLTSRMPIGNFTSIIDCSRPPRFGRDSAQVAWRIADSKKTGGQTAAAEEAQAREQYFAFRSRVESGLRDLLETENRLRLLMGLAATDGRLIRPIDEPAMAKVSFEWCAIVAESLERSPELRKVRWEVKQRELELVAAKNTLLPQLDVGARYRWIGAGNELINGSGNGQWATSGSSAYDTLMHGDFQEFAILFNFDIPVGFRRELAAVRNSQLKLARQKALLEDAELNLTHILSSAVRSLDLNYQLTQTNFNRLSAAEVEVGSLLELYKGGKIPANDLLEAQRRRAEAQAEFYRATCDHAKAIAGVHFNKGSLLEYNNISLAEGPWPQKAYWDALERARERDASYYLNYGFTRPGVISRGEVSQNWNESPNATTLPGEPTPAVGDAIPESLPAEPHPGQPNDGGFILNKPEATDGPVTGAPTGPALNAPVTRTADNGPAGRAVRPSQPRAFDWDALGLDGQPGPAPAASGVVPAGYSSRIGDAR